MWKNEFFKSAIDMFKQMHSSPTPEVADSIFKPNPQKPKT
jgi:hypothetical protein